MKLIELLKILLQGGPVNGYKSYLAAAFLIFLALNAQFGWLTPEQTQTLVALAAAFGLYAIKDGQRKAVEQIQATKQEIQALDVKWSEQEATKPPDPTAKSIWGR